MYKGFRRVGVRPGRRPERSAWTSETPVGLDIPRSPKADENAEGEIRRRARE